ncbi:MAG: hypothetical protein Q4A49_04685 [Neisseria sp.]|nr:hypothetical protein [Neisseria sp.]
MRYRLHTITGLLLCNLSFSASAQPFGTQDFLPNCDIRLLDLNSRQLEQIKELRTEYKQALDKAVAKENRSERSRRMHIQRLLAAPHFDEQQAIRYIQSRYSENQQFALNELAIQYKFHNILNTRQRKIWLGNCVR